MRPNVELIAFDTKDESHVHTLYSVRTHPQVVPFLRGPPPPDFSRHVEYLRKLPSQKRFFVVRLGASLCGYCQLTYDPAHVEIGMALHPDFWDRGIGFQALSCLLEFLHSEKAPNRAILLFVKKSNLRAISLYKKHGFKQQGEENEQAEYLMSYSP